MKKSMMLLLSLLMVMGIGFSSFPGVASSQTAGEEALPPAREQAEMFREDSYQGIPYLTGGVGLDEREVLREKIEGYNLKLIFAREEGTYLSFVDVAIDDAGGRRMMEVPSVGPWFYTRLPQGNYTVTAVSDGRSITKEVQVEEAEQKELHFHWQP